LSLHSFIVFLGTAIILGSFFVAIKFTKKEKPEYFRYILLFIISGLLVSCNTILYWKYKFPDYSIYFNIEQILSFCQFLLLALFFSTVLKNSRFEKKIRYFFCISVILEIILLSITISMKLFVYARVSSNIFLIIFSLFFYRDLLNTKPNITLIKYPAFWIVSGIFFSYCVSFPIYCLIPYLARFPEYKNIRFQIFSIVNASFIILYLLVIKSYLCLKHRQS
jgi:hypothetical protein